MAHHTQINVIVHGIPREIRASTIHRYLPNLWQRYVRRCTPIDRLIPVHYLRHVEMDRYVREVLKYLFGYLTEIDHTSGPHTYLHDCLETAWITHGPQGRQKVFSALGRILSPENFGCNAEIWETMETFVIKHGSEILRPGKWFEYVRVLDEVDKSNKFGLEGFLCWMIASTQINLRHLQQSTSVDKLQPRTLKLLGTLIRQRDSNGQGFGTGHGCLHFYENARRMRLGDRNGRRGESHVRWTDYSNEEIGPVDQCERCFQLYGPVRANHRLPRPRTRARSADCLDRVSHHDHYETEISPWIFDSADIPRYMQPFFHEAGHRHFYPRHDHRVEVVG